MPHIPTTTTKSTDRNTSDQQTWNQVYCYTSTFEIEAAKVDDIGTVYFVVGNERGLADAQITINLTRGSEHIPLGR